MTSTYNDLQSLRPSAVADHIAAGMEDYFNPDYFGTGRGLSYTASDFTGEPGGFSVDITALADDRAKRRFRIHIEALG